MEGGSVAASLACRRGECTAGPSAPVRASVPAARRRSPRSVTTCSSPCCSSRCSTSPATSSTSGSSVSPSSCRRCSWCSPPGGSPIDSIGDGSRRCSCSVVGRVRCRARRVQPVRNRDRCGRCSRSRSCSGASDAMLAPARRSIPPLIVEQADFPQVVALWTATFTGSAIVGPVLGGFLYTIGPEHCLHGGGGARVRVDRPDPRTRVRAAPGTSDRPTDAVGSDGGLALRAPHADRSRRHLARSVRSALRRSDRADPGGCERAARGRRHRIRMAACGAGNRCSGDGDLAGGPADPAPCRADTLLVVVGVFGAGTMVFGITRSYTVAFIALVVISAADMVSMYIRGSIVPLVTPDEQLGRVTAVEGVFIGGVERAGRVREWCRGSRLRAAVGDRRRWFHHGADRRCIRRRCSRRYAGSTRSTSSNRSAHPAADLREGRGTSRRSRTSDRRRSVRCRRQRVG